MEMLVDDGVDGVDGMEMLVDGGVDPSSMTKAGAASVSGATTLLVGPSQRI